QVRGHLHGFAHNFLKLPALELGERPALDDAHHVADVGLTFLIVRVKLLALADNALIDRMGHAPRDFHHNGLRHLVRDHRAHLLVLGNVYDFRHVALFRLFAASHSAFLPRIRPRKRLAAEGFASVFTIAAGAATGSAGLPDFA